MKVVKLPDLRNGRLLYFDLVKSDGNEENPGKM